MIERNISKIGGKILLLATDLSITGGIPRYTKYQVSVLKDLGFKIYLITGYKIGEFFTKDDFEDIYSLNLTHGQRINLLGKIKIIVTTLKFIKQKRINLLLVNQIGLSPVALLAKRLFGIYYITNIYGAELWSNPKIREIGSLKKSDVIIADSKHTIDYAVNSIGIDNKKMFLVYDPVDIERFKPLSKEQVLYIFEKYNLPKDKKIILTLARLDRFKGHEIIIDVIDKLNEDVIYVIGGAGKKEEFLKGMAKDKKVLNKKVFFIGKVEEKDLPSLYNIADIFVLVSKKEKGEGEGLPLSLIEASACGVPIIAGDEDGSAEAVINGINGLVVSPRNANNVLENLQILLHSEEQRLKMGKAGRKIIEDRFSYNSFKDKHIELLKSMLT